MNEIKTIIYSPTGWFGSPSRWNDPSYAFRNRKEIDARIYGPLWSHNLPKDDWVWLGNDKAKVAKDLGIDIDILPEWDYEYVELER